MAVLISIAITFMSVFNVTAYQRCILRPWMNNMRIKTQLHSKASAIPTHHVGILGGGLAGLALAHNLFEKSEFSSSLHITIYDVAPVGQGGASSVAGGLLHPLSPRGKLVHWGLEGLASGSRLVRSASRWTPQCVLRDRLYRVALTEDNVDKLKALETHDKTVATNGMFRWIERDEIEALLGCTHSLGGLELSQGCCVLHVPSYLDGLYKACQQMGSIQWKITTDPIPPEELASYSAFIFAAGAGMLQKGILDQSSFPVNIVRGQSLVLKSEGSPLLSEALLCGKYISPMLDTDNAILVGASHEFGTNPMSQDLLYQELKEKSYNLAPQLWDNSYVEKVTCGYRVQSKRGNLGRTPIVGHLKDNLWIFTGLSSRGLLYHGIYAEKLSDMILSSDYGKKVRDTHPYLDWWRNR